MPDNELSVPQFLDALWGSKPPNSYILIWELPGKKSYWFDDIAQASRMVEKLKADHDVYVGVGLSPEKLGDYERCENEHIAGIAGLWVDIDIADPVHKKPNLPPSIEDVNNILAYGIIPPTIVIHSGHGVQAWWLFKEVWIFDSPEERSKAQDLVKRWIGALRHYASTKGWDIDATHDLARVLRIPGTMNRKDKKNLIVTRCLSYSPANVYTADDPETYLPDLEPSPLQKKPSELSRHGGPIDWKQIKVTLKEDAHPPMVKLSAMMANTPKFNDTWERKRPDFEDQSPSAFDMSLASYMVQGGFTDQEITDTLIFNRKEHGDDLKIEREDYYPRTIARARSTVRTEKTALNIKDAYKTLSESWPADADMDEMTDEIRQSILDCLGSLLNIPLKRIVRYLAETKSFKFETTLGDVMIGDGSNMATQRIVKGKIYSDVRRVMMHDFTKQQWNIIIKAIADVAIDESVEADSAALAKEWVASYLEEHKGSITLKDMTNTQAPFLVDGQVCIYGTHFRQWLSKKEHGITPKVMGQSLRALGAVPDKANVKVDGVPTTRSIWVLPLGLPQSDEEKGKSN